MLNKLFLGAILVLSQYLMTANASAENETNAVASAPEAQTASTSTAPTNKAPKLSIRWNCGDCAVNDKVIPLIEESYAAEVVKNNQTISEDDVASVEITSYRQRSPGMRVMFGFMAGKDRISLKVTYKGKEFTAEDYSANAISGMNSLCASVAKISYSKITNPAKE